ncbi:hypothetical protein HU200_011429 [Digitaria exilis]|uniref:Protein kinase domain-containing protein n=1 Tax=Digitaria exilis TaxID=1010633 RepID=A0A835FFT7_9POAL|nr:hypothetical protein HU200_011429 [Digitaria exilis]CAB3489786.1 unnamed protein product [Digitaria exilis]
MAAAVQPLPSLTEGELLAARRRRWLLRARVPSPAPKSPAPSPPSAAAARNDQGRLTRLDSYKRLKKIGEGAFGTVCKARDRRTGEVVAIKSAVGNGPGGAEALLREAALLAACAANPAVVKLREVARGSEAADLHLVLEYMGMSLHDIVSERRRRGLPLTESETRRVMEQLLTGVGTMHAQGIMHFDLKPGNVLVGDEDRRLRICDFGLAKSVAALPLEGEPEGTPGYIAPEMLLREKDCGAPADVWALGCIMAEIVNGQSLFAEDDLYQQLASIVDLLGIPDDVSLMPLGITATAPSKLREKVPEERLSPAGFDVLQGLLQYDPKDRLTAMAALEMPWFQATMDD